MPFDAPRETIRRIAKNHALANVAKPVFAFLVERDLNVVTDLYLGERGTPQGNPTFAHRNALGPCIKYDGTGDAFQFSQGGTAQKPNAPTCFTAVFTVELTSAAVAQRFISTSSGTAGGMRVDITSAGALEATATGNASVSLGITLSASVPYAIAVSWLTTSSVKAVVRRLDTGAIVGATTTSNGNTVVAGDNVWNFGCMSVANTAGLQGYSSMAAAFIGPALVPLSLLYEITRDPWSIFESAFDDLDGTLFVPSGTSGTGTGAAVTDTSSAGASSATGDANATGGAVTDTSSAGASSATGNASGSGAAVTDTSSAGASSATGAATATGAAVTDTSSAGASSGTGTATATAGAVTDVSSAGSSAGHGDANANAGQVTDVSLAGSSSATVTGDATGTGGQVTDTSSADSSSGTGTATATAGAVTDTSSAGSSSAHGQGALTVRERCLAALFAELAAIPGVKSFRNRTSIIDPEEMPAVVLYDGSETNDLAQEYSYLRIIEMPVDIECHVTAADDASLGPALNVLFGQVMAATQQDYTLGGNAIDVRYAGQETPPVDKTPGAQPTMGGIFKFTVQYQMDTRDPTSLGLA